MLLMPFGTQGEPYGVHLIYSIFPSSGLEFLRIKMLAFDFPHYRMLRTKLDKQNTTKLTSCVTHISTTDLDEWVPERLATAPKVRH